MSEEARDWFTFQKMSDGFGAMPKGSRHHVRVRRGEPGEALPRAWRKFKRDYPSENTMAWEREPEPAPSTSYGGEA